MELIKTLQAQLESLYGIRVGESAFDYLIGLEELGSLLPDQDQTNIPKELFLVNPNPKDDCVEVALYLSPDLKQNLNTYNPMESLGPENMSDFLTLIEGISHFVYYLHKASLEYGITQLEMELQAEIDKFLVMSLLTQSELKDSSYLIDLLFENYDLHQYLNEDESERYHTASELARKFCFHLSKQMKGAKIDGALRELRKFYPLTQEQKIRHILT